MKWGVVTGDRSRSWILYSPYPGLALGATKHLYLHLRMCVSVQNTRCFARWKQRNTLVGSRLSR